MHTRGEVLEAPRLVTSGPYARMRHPLYLSNALVGAGFAWLHLGLGIVFLLYTFLLLLFLAALMRSEDAWLSRRFPVAWADWARDVPVLGWGHGQGADARMSLARVVREDVWTWLSWVVVLVAVLARKSFACGHL